MTELTCAKNDGNEAIAKLPPLMITRQYLNNTTISRNLSAKQVSVKANKRITLKLTGSNKSDIFATLYATVDVTITPFDMAVMDAAYTILCSGYEGITVNWIARVLSGNPAQTMTQQKTEKIESSITKLSSCHIMIDCESEMKSRKDTKGKTDTFEFQSCLLPLGDCVIRTINGRNINFYPFTAKPALYSYAETLGQIISIPAELLDTHHEYADTDEAILIKRYVIKRVAQIVSINGLVSNKLSFSWFSRDYERTMGLFTELGYKPDTSSKWRAKRQKINRIVKLTLKSLKNKKYIDDFEEYREDKTKNPASPINGYKIFYTRK